MSIQLLNWPLTNEHLRQFMAFTIFSGMSDVDIERATVKIDVEVETTSPQNFFHPGSFIGRSWSLQSSVRSYVPHKKSGHLKPATMPGTITSVFTS